MERDSESVDLDSWIAEIVQDLELRPGSRVLQVTAHEPRTTTALLGLTGSTGHVLVVEPNRYRAAAAAAAAAAIAPVDADAPDGHEQLTVASHSPSTADRFGLHDAVVVAPLALPDELWQSVPWGSFVASHLRPGGRVVIDLPAPEPPALLVGAWREAAAGLESVLAGLAGPSEDVAAAALRDAGLRQVESRVGTHVLRFASAHGLATFVARLLVPEELDDDLVGSLALAFAGRFRGTGPGELVVHRTHVRAMR